MAIGQSDGGSSLIQIPSFQVCQIDNQSEL